MRNAWLISVLKYLKKVFRPTNHSVAEPFGNKPLLFQRHVAGKMKFCFVFVSKNAICHKIVDIDHKFLSCSRPIRGWFSIFSKKFLKSALVLSRTRQTITDGIIIEQRVIASRKSVTQIPTAPGRLSGLSTLQYWTCFFFYLWGASLVRGSLSWVLLGFCIHQVIFNWRWPEPMPVGYVFDLRFLEWKIHPISMMFGILNKEWSIFKKMLFIFLKV